MKVSDPVFLRENMETRCSFSLHTMPGRIVKGGVPGAAAEGEASMDRMPLMLREHDGAGVSGVRASFCRAGVTVISFKGPPRRWFGRLRYVAIPQGRSMRS